jgi:serine/threonine protein kinase/tetratricopeptide (TPR) repeat protein
MKTREWDEIERLFHAALTLGSAQRGQYLLQACSGNEGLQKEVESLIGALEDSNGLMEQPVFELGLKVLGSNADLMVGKEIGTYKILKVLGRGGMGEVYLAEDTRLGRKVALKFLSPEFVGDNWAKRQLVKEAQSVAILDHPNICHVYGIEEHDGHSFIVMQYVEGETLAVMIRSQALSADRLLLLSQQIVGALAEAHAHGIIHRDIKPKNIMVMNSGQVKVLDFGLAKTILQKQSSEAAADSLSHLSQFGLVPGTIAYMSPEQLRGERLDYRSDIFSVGTVLYEMVTGRNPYARETNADIISAVLTIKPSPFRLTSAQTSREFDRIVQKCLEKKKEDRYQAVSDLLLDLEVDHQHSVGRSILDKYFPIRTTVSLASLMLLAVVLAFIYSHFNVPRSVAVLPVINESGDPSLDYLGDGLADNIINKLSGLSKLRVKPWTVVLGYKGQGIDPGQVARALKVDAILVGKVSGTRGSLVLQMSLISSEDGKELWGQQRAIDLENVVPIEQEVSQKVTSTLELWSRGDENRIRAARQSTNPEARNEYMLGRYYWRNRDNNHTLKDAIDHFSAAIKLDPNYAEAYAGLADCYALGNVVSYPDLGLTTMEAMNRAERAAKDALEHNENLAEAYTSLGFVNMKFHRNWREAEREFKTAIELKPDYALAYYGYSNLRSILGPQSEALTLSLRAKELDPFSPVTAYNLCREYYYARIYDEASRCFDKLVQENPDYTNGQYGRGIVYLKKGLSHDAITLLESLYAKDKRSAAAALGYAYGITGNRDAARKVLAEMGVLQGQVYIPSQEFVLVYLGLGDNENTFFWLRKAVTENTAASAYIAVDPIYDPIRSDPRFIDIEASLNLPEHPAL